MKSEEQYQAAADWAEYEMNEIPLPAHAVVMRGAEAAAAGRALLESALGVEELEKVLGRGYPKLNVGAPAGTTASVKQIRMPDDMIKGLDTLAAARGVKAAVLVREAVADYLRRQAG